MLDIIGQWSFPHDLATEQVPCPACGAAVGAPCVNKEGQPLLRGLIHGSRLCEIVEVVQEATGLSSTENGSISVPSVQSDCGQGKSVTS